MQLLDQTAFLRWCEPSKIQLNEHYHLVFPEKLDNIMMALPNKLRQLRKLSMRMADWFPANTRRMIYLSHWETYPPDDFILFERIFRGCGESRRLIDAPAILFEGLPTHNRYEAAEPNDLINTLEVQESAIMYGMLFLIASFNWEAYVLGEGLDEYIYLGDEYIVFAGGNKAGRVSRLIEDLQLEVIQDVKQAWSRS